VKLFLQILFSLIEVFIIFPLILFWLFLQQLILLLVKNWNFNYYYFILFIIIFRLIFILLIFLIFLFLIIFLFLFPFITILKFFYHFFMLSKELFILFLSNKMSSFYSSFSPILYTIPIFSLLI
jgi:hypothetical protein